MKQKCWPLVYVKDSETLHENKNKKVTNDLFQM